MEHLVQQRVQHADAEDPAGGKRQAEHESQVGALISLNLETERKKTQTPSFETTEAQRLQPSRSALILFLQQVAATLEQNSSPSPAWTEPASSSPWLGTA